MSSHILKKSPIALTYSTIVEGVIESKYKVQGKMSSHKLGIQLHFFGYKEHCIQTLVTIVWIPSTFLYYNLYGREVYDLQHYF